MAKVLYKSPELKTAFINKNSKIKIPILICDAICGAGKTQSAISYINSTANNVRFIFVTPFLKEVERIIDACPDKHFKQPKEIGNSKKRDFLNLLQKNENIVCTHALYSYITKKDLQSIGIDKLKPYILIMDEVADVIKNIDTISKDETGLLINEILTEKGKQDPLVVIDDTGKVNWNRKKFEVEKFSDIKDLCDAGCVYAYQNTSLFALLPIEVFDFFSKVIILTYIFNGQFQKYYYNFFGRDIKYLHIEKTDLKGYKLDVSDKSLDDSNVKYKFVDGVFDAPQKIDLSNIVEHIYLVDSSLNDICPENKNYKKCNSFSVSWLDREKFDNYYLDKARKNTYNFFMNYAKTPSENNMWTTFIEDKDALKGNGYTKGFVPINSRATNEYRNKTALAYLGNCYMNPCVKNFFVKNDIKVDEESYALSELLQWVFRSAIRDGKDIFLYIPSKRMRTLFVKWCEENSNGVGPKSFNSSRV